MAVRCPCATAVGPARLEGHRFLVNQCGWATVVPAPGSITHGVLWDLSEECLQTLDRQERVDEGLYHKRDIAIIHGGRAIVAMVYVAADSLPGRPNPGYLERIVAWAGKWSMPPDYLEEISSWFEGASSGTSALPG